jgi:hypothetical protein
MMRAHNELRVITTQPHLIDEPEALDQIAAIAGQWFTDWFRSPAPEDVPGAEELPAP